MTRELSFQCSCLSRLAAAYRLKSQVGFSASSCLWKMDLTEDFTLYYLGEARTLYNKLEPLQDAALFQSEVLPQMQAALSTQV